MTGGQLHWLWWAGGGVVTLIALVLLLWALFADRARGRRRCPKCWYDLSGTVGMRCSECGFEAQQEKQLHRTRRRWRGVTLAVLMVVAVAVTLGIALSRRGWIGAMPDTVLILAVPFADPFPSTLLNTTGVVQELSSRITAASGTTDIDFWDWQWRMLIKRIAAYDLKREALRGNQAPGGNQVPFWNQPPFGKLAPPAATSLETFFLACPDIEPALEVYREGLADERPPVVQQSMKRLSQFDSDITCEDLVTLIKLIPDNQTSPAVRSAEQSVFPAVQARPDCAAATTPELVKIYHTLRTTDRDEIGRRVAVTDIIYTFGLTMTDDDDVRVILRDEIERATDPFVRRLALTSLAVIEPEEAARLLIEHAPLDEYREASDVFARLSRRNVNETRRFADAILISDDSELIKALRRTGLHHAAGEPDPEQ